MDCEPFLLDIPPTELDLRHCLCSGQAFRWAMEPDGWWRGVVGNVLIAIRGSPRGFECFTLPERGRMDIIRHYFRLDDDITSIYKQLAAADEHVAELIRRFRGLRLLRQDPEETLLSFCCSAANSIPRISRAVEELSARYGTRIATWRGRYFHAFPSALVLAAADADDLARIAGLGFRGENLNCVARQLVERPPGWLESLKVLSYSDAHRELTSLRCVGRKIADCVCLFALGHDEAVPVDTHVRQIVARLYFPEMKSRSITDSVYNTCVRIFREHFGELAGWAQQFLYYEDVLLSRGRNEAVAQPILDK